MNTDVDHLLLELLQVLDKHVNSYATLEQIYVDLIPILEEHAPDTIQELRENDHTFNSAVSQYYADGADDEQSED